MRFKNTPGPWYFDKVTTCCGHCFRVGSREQLDTPKDELRHKVPSYACLYVDYGNMGDEAEANASLISKAPKMLDVLRHAQDIMKLSKRYKHSTMLEEIENVLAEIAGEA